MNKKSGTSKDAADKLVRGINRKTRKHYSAEEKIRTVPAGLGGEESISALCRREGIAESLSYSWSKEFLEAARTGLSGDTAQQATAPEVKELRSESAALKKVLAKLTLENPLLKKHDRGSSLIAPLVRATLATRTTHEIPCIREGGDHPYGRGIAYLSTGHRLKMLGIPSSTC